MKYLSAVVASMGAVVIISGCALAGSHGNSPEDALLAEGPRLIVTRDGKPVSLSGKSYETYLVEHLNWPPELAGRYVACRTQACLSTVDDLVKRYFASSPEDRSVQP